MPTLKEQLEELNGVVERFNAELPKVQTLFPVFSDCFRNGHKLLTCGNGGSAADALHMSEELIGRYRGNRRALPAISLASDVTALTCIANDWNYEAVFSRQVEGLGQKGDILVGFSGSGNSVNVIRAIETAKKQGVITVALLGKGGGKTKGLADYEVIVPSNNTARVQEIHTWILHVILEHIEAEFAE